MDQVVWAILTFQEFSCQPLETFTIEVSGFRQAAGLSTCVNLPISIGQSSDFFSGKWLAFCSQPSNTVTYDVAKAKFMHAQKLSGLPAAGFLTATLLMPR